jgi:hypothetical protein
MSIGSLLSRSGKALLHVGCDAGTGGRKHSSHVVRYPCYPFVAGNFRDCLADLFLKFFQQLNWME